MENNFKLNIFYIKFVSGPNIIQLMFFLQQVSKYLSFGQQIGSAILSMRFGCMYDHGDGLKFCDSINLAPKDANVVVGAVLRVPPSSRDPDLGPMKATSRFFPGEMVGDNFVPGQRMSSANGEFIPATCIRSGLPFLLFKLKILFFIQ